MTDGTASHWKYAIDMANVYRDVSRARADSAEDRSDRLSLDGHRQNERAHVIFSFFLSWGRRRECPAIGR